MTFDIKKKNPELAAEKGYEFELEANGDKTGAFFTVRGDESKTVKAYNRRVFKEMEARKVSLRRKGKEEDLSLDELTEMTIEAAFQRVISFRGLEEDGVEIPSTPENIRRILTDYDFVRTQVLAASANEFNFRPE